jgi:hypothetical protein
MSVLLGRHYELEGDLYVHQDLIIVKGVNLCLSVLLT